jgi:hypothetical protein
MAEGAYHDLVTCLVAGKFFAPESTIVDRFCGVLWTAVPEAAIHEQSDTMPEENEIRTAEQANVATPAGDAVSAKQRDHRKLSGFVAATTHARHDFRPLCFRENVGHSAYHSLGFACL